MSARSALCSLTQTFFWASDGQLALGRMHAATWLALRPWLAACGAATSAAIAAAARAHGSAVLWEGAKRMEGGTF